MPLFIDLVAAMQKDASSSDVSASHVGRVRHRRRTNEVSCALVIFFFSNFVPCKSGLLSVFSNWTSSFIFSLCVAFTPCAGLFFFPRKSIYASILQIFVLI